MKKNTILSKKSYNFLCLMLTVCIILGAVPITVSASTPGQISSFEMIPSGESKNILDTVIYRAGTYSQNPDANVSSINFANVKQYINGGATSDCSFYYWDVKSNNSSLIFVEGELKSNVLDNRVNDYYTSSYDLKLTVNTNSAAPVSGTAVVTVRISTEEDMSNAVSKTFTVKVIDDTNDGSIGIELKKNSVFLSANEICSVKSTDEYANLTISQIIGYDFSNLSGTSEKLLTYYTWSAIIVKEGTDGSFIPLSATDNSVIEISTDTDNAASVSSTGEISVAAGVGEKTLKITPLEVGKAWIALTVEPSESYNGKYESRIRYIEVEVTRVIGGVEFTAETTRKLYSEDTREFYLGIKDIAISVNGVKINYDDFVFVNPDITNDNVTDQRAYITDINISATPTLTGNLEIEELPYEISDITVLETKLSELESELIGLEAELSNFNDELIELFRTESETEAEIEEKQKEINEINTILFEFFTEDGTPKYTYGYKIKTKDDKTPSGKINADVSLTIREEESICEKGGKENHNLTVTPVDTCCVFKTTSKSVSVGVFLLENDKKIYDFTIKQIFSPENIKADEDEEKVISGGSTVVTYVDKYNNTDQELEFNVSNVLAYNKDLEYEGFVEELGNEEYSVTVEIAQNSGNPKAVTIERDLDNNRFFATPKDVGKAKLTITVKRISSDESMEEYKIEKIIYINVTNIGVLEAQEGSIVKAELTYGKESVYDGRKIYLLNNKESALTIDIGKIYVADSTKSSANYMAELKDYIWSVSLDYPSPNKTEGDTAGTFLKLSEDSQSSGTVTTDNFSKDIKSFTFDTLNSSTGNRSSDYVELNLTIVPILKTEPEETEQTTELTTEPTTEQTTESTTESTTEQTTESTTESTTEQTTEPITTTAPETESTDAASYYIVEYDISPAAEANIDVSDLTDKSITIRIKIYTSELGGLFLPVVDYENETLKIAEGKTTYTGNEDESDIVHWEWFTSDSSEVKYMYCLKAVSDTSSQGSEKWYPFLGDEMDISKLIPKSGTYRLGIRIIKDGETGEEYLPEDDGNYSSNYRKVALLSSRTAASATDKKSFVYKNGEIIYNGKSLVTITYRVGISDWITTEIGSDAGSGINVAPQLNPLGNTVEIKLAGTEDVNDPAKSKFGSASFKVKVPKTAKKPTIKDNKKTKLSGFSTKLSWSADGVTWKQCTRGSVLYSQLKSRFPGLETDSTGSNYILYLKTNATSKLSESEVVKVIISADKYK